MRMQKGFEWVPRGFEWNSRRVQEGPEEGSGTKGFRSGLKEVRKELERLPGEVMAVQVMASARPTRSSFTI